MKAEAPPGDRSRTHSTEWQGKKQKTEECLIIAIFTHAQCEIAQQKSLKGDQLQIKPLSHFKEQPNKKNTSTLRFRNEGAEIHKHIIFT